MKINELLVEAAKTTDFTKLTTSDLFKCYANAGYVSDSKADAAYERKSFIDSRFAGLVKGKPMYVAFCHDDNEGGYYLSRMYIEVDKDGKGKAEPEGRPFFEDESKEVVKKRFDSGAK